MKSQISLLILFSVCAITYTGDETTDLILSARTDYNDVTSIKSIRYPKDLNDVTLKTTLAQAYNVQTLIAQNNVLYQPEPVACYKLSSIDFSNGTIRVFSIGDWIQAMPRLQKLNLARNKIVSIASAYDTEQASTTIPSWDSITLQEIDLSYNELTELDLHIVNNAKNLALADLSHNKITTVVMPKTLRHRTVCEVYLQNNQLSKAVQCLLKKCNVLDTEEYENSLQSHGGAGLITGTLTGIGSSMAMIFTLSDNIHPAVKFTIGIVNGLAQSGIGFFLGYGIKKCIAHDTVHTYQPFIFIFDDEQADDAEVQL